MALQEIIDRLTVSGQVEQSAYVDQLGETEAIFDRLVDNREAEVNIRESRYVFQAIDLGEYLVRGTMKKIAAQPTIDTPARSENKVRTIQLWTPRTKLNIDDVTGPLYLNNGEFHGYYAIQSVQRQATAETITKLANFRELLDEVLTFI